MNWSDKVEFYESLKRRDKLKDEDLMPEVNESEHLLMEIFIELSSTRQVGMGLSPIPTTVYWEAQARYGLTDAALNMLRLLDGEYLKQNGSKS